MLVGELKELVLFHLKEKGINDPFLLSTPLDNNLSLKDTLLKSSLDIFINFERFSLTLSYELTPGRPALWAPIQVQDLSSSSLVKDLFVSL